MSICHHFPLITESPPPSSWGVSLSTNGISSGHATSNNRGKNATIMFAINARIGKRATWMSFDRPKAKKSHHSLKGKSP